MKKVQSHYYVVANDFLQEYWICQVVNPQYNVDITTLLLNNGRISGKFDTYEDTYNSIIKRCLSSEWKYVPNKNVVLLDVNATVSEKDDELMIRLKNFIDDFCVANYDFVADFADIDKVLVAYVTDEDTDKPIEAYANLRNLCINKYYNEQLFETKYFASALDMGNFFRDAKFNDLVVVSDEVKSKLIKNVKGED